MVFPPVCSLCPVGRILHVPPSWGWTEVIRNALLLLSNCSWIFSLFGREFVVQFAAFVKVNSELDPGPREMGIDGD